jgi:hypothetical protein
MKRFATDMLRILKARGGPLLKVEDFVAAFTQAFPSREHFLPQDYGLCFLSDLITELVEHSSLVTIVKDEEKGCELLGMNNYREGTLTSSSEAKINSITSLASQESLK